MLFNSATFVLVFISQLNPSMLTTCPSLIFPVILIWMAVVNYVGNFSKTDTLETIFSKFEMVYNPNAYTVWLNVKYKILFSYKILYMSLHCRLALKVSYFIKALILPLNIYSFLLFWVLSLVSLSLSLF